jgi:hypothetical protein
MKRRASAGVARDAMRTYPLLVLLLGCNSAPAREAYAVGAAVGGGSVIFGSSDCTYAVRPASVAALDADRKGPVVLVGAGELDQTCGDATTTYDVVEPTAIRIDGPASLGRGGHPGEYIVTALAGTRRLRADGVDLRPDWTLGPDCAGRITGEQDLGAGHDFGDPSYAFDATAVGAGTCTLSVTARGFHATRTIAAR